MEHMSSDLPQIYDQDYRHFDTLIWQVPTWASAIFAFTVTAAGLLVTNVKEIETRFALDVQRSLSVFLFAVFVVLLLLANALVRFRLHQAALPSPPRTRAPRPKWQPRGQSSLLLIVFVEAAVLLAFALIAAGAPLSAVWGAAGTFLLFGFYLFERWVLAFKGKKPRAEHGSLGEKCQMTVIPCDVAKDEYGITCEHEKMPNGELRFRLRSADGSAYIRTAATATSGWQKSHYHKHVRETYIVQRGWMAMASLRDRRLVVERYEENGIVTTDPLIPHNVYLPADAVIHTVKHGNAKDKDWWEDADLDKQTTVLTEADVLSKSGGFASS